VLRTTVFGAGVVTRLKTVGHGPILGGMVEYLGMSSGPRNGATFIQAVTCLKVIEFAATLGRAVGAL